MIIIAISGKQGAGKTTTAVALCQMLTEGRQHFGLRLGTAFGAAALREASLRDLDGQCSLAGDKEPTHSVVQSKRSWLSSWLYSYLPSWLTSALGLRPPTTSSSQVPRKLYSVNHLTFASGLYDLCKLVHTHLTGIIGADIPWVKNRELLQSLGAYSRGLHQDIWTNSIVRKIRALSEGTKQSGSAQPIVVISDLRFHNELSTLKSLVSLPAKLIIIRLECTQSIRARRCSAFGGAGCQSEVELDNYDSYDEVIDTEHTPIDEVVRRIAAHCPIELSKSKDL